MEQPAFGPGIRGTDPDWSWCTDAEEDDLSRVIGQYPDSEFPHLTRSTIPLLAYWKQPAKRIAEMLQDVNLPYSPHSTICFEYPVPSADSKSKASFTDIMYLSDTVTIAIEGKWTEPRYDDIATWLGKGILSHRKKVLAHWLAHIKPYCRTSVQPEALGNIVYQMLHRTASACAARTDVAGAFYLCFSDSEHDHQDTLHDLRAWKDALQPLDCLRLFLQRIEIQQTDFYRELESSIERLDSAVCKAEAIRLGLREHDLFEFVPEQIIEV